MAKAPNTYDAEAIPEATRAAVDRLMASGDLFRYTHPETAAVPALEARIRSHDRCQIRPGAVFLFGGHLSVYQGTGPAPRRARSGPRIYLCRRTLGGGSRRLHPVLVEVGDNYRIDLDDFSANSTMEFPLS